MVVTMLIAVESRHAGAGQMISPYVRRRRLAAELAALRDAAGLTQQQLAKATGSLSQSAVTRLETGKARPNISDVLRVLEVLPDVTPEQWEDVVAIAHEAAHRGWWETDEIDPRQARYADLEAGATTIREYQTPFVPGLLQTPEYTQARAQFSPPDGQGKKYSADALIRARSGRQRMVRRPGGPVYEVIIDELVIRRPTAPPEVLAPQLHSLATISDDRVCVLVLPVGAVIDQFSAPQSAFSLYEYPDERDTTVVAVDTVTSDLTLADPGETEPYVALYARLRKAALPQTKSAALLRQVAREMEAP